SWARPVSVPCPISERTTRMTQVSSGLTRTHALISLMLSAVPRAPCASADAMPNGSCMPKASPPPAAAEPTMNLRRERLVFPLSLIVFFMRISSRLGRCQAVVGSARAGRTARSRCNAHGIADARVGSAAANIGHRVVDILVARIRILIEQRCRGHDLSRLAIAALRYVELCPGLLHRMRARRRKSFDGDDFVAGLDRADGDRARAHHVAVDVHRARAALRDAAAVFRPGEADVFANYPQQRRIGPHLHVTDFAVDIELCHVPPRTVVCPVAVFLGGSEETRLVCCQRRKAYSNWRHPAGAASGVLLLPWPAGTQETVLALERRIRTRGPGSARASSVANSACNGAQRSPHMRCLRWCPARQRLNRLRQSRPRVRLCAWWAMASRTRSAAPRATRSAGVRSSSPTTRPTASCAMRYRTRACDSRAILDRHSTVSRASSRLRSCGCASPTTCDSTPRRSCQATTAPKGSIASQALFAANRY